MRNISDTESFDPVLVSEPGAHWICGYCGVQVRWMSGHKNRGLPDNWTEEQQGPVCLGCRRELAANAAITGTSSDLPIKERARLRSFALLEFEVSRDPNRSNAQIASAVHTSVVAVQKARDRLGAVASVT